LGCGFGEFARLFFRDRDMPDVGIDIDRGELRRVLAEPAAIYRSILQGDARRLPFPEGTFKSAISISTMEHIPGVEATIHEVARVLQPGALFAFTVPITSLNRSLIGHRVLRLARLSLADAYAGALHKGLTHVNVWPASRWLECTEAAGLDLRSAAATVSPSATMAFEALLPAAFANRLWRIATGRRPPRPGPFVRVVERVLRPLVMQDSAGGSNLFVVARKPET
jgi:SAM-dependent methyltransferase